MVISAVIAGQRFNQTAHHFVSIFAARTVAANEISLELRMHAMTFIVDAKRFQLA